MCLIRQRKIYKFLDLIKWIRAAEHKIAMLSLDYSEDGKDITAQERLMAIVVAAMEETFACPTPH